VPARQRHPLHRLSAIPQPPTLLPTPLAAGVQPLRAQAAAVLGAAQQLVVAVVRMAAAGADVAAWHARAAGGLAAAVARQAGEFLRVPDGGGAAVALADELLCAKGGRGGVLCA